MQLDITGGKILSSIVIYKQWSGQSPVGVVLKCLLFLAFACRWEFNKVFLFVSEIHNIKYV